MSISNDSLIPVGFHQTGPRADYLWLCREHLIYDCFLLFGLGHSDPPLRLAKLQQWAVSVVNCNDLDCELQELCPQLVFLATFENAVYYFYTQSSQVHFIFTLWPNITNCLEALQSAQHTTPPSGQESETTLGRGPRGTHAKVYCWPFSTTIYLLTYSI